MGTKIQINSLEALERLIGNDNELEMEIRNSVVENFARKHLKSLANEELMKKFAEGIKKEIIAEFFDEIITNNYRKGSEWCLNSMAKELVKDAVKNAFTNEVDAAIHEVISERYGVEQIDKKVQAAAEWISDSLAQTVLSNKLDKIVEARMKEKLGIK